MELSMSTFVCYKETYHIKDIVSVLEEMKKTGFTEVVFYHDKENKCVEINAVHLEIEGR